ncbi:MAG: MBL fold metallo-hydrolase [Candidatus Ryanbacteria bacterium]|nr:MBL fold metallo-hydrolase [Candidatus Ryanbacteria bacterium]
MFRISFYGGAQEVTGANYLVETKTARVLVDCGMFQCPHFCVKKNLDAFPYDPGSLEALFVTHAHIDHIGRIPKLVKNGFRGTIYSTPPTRDFGNLMLEDSFGVLEKEAKNEGHQSPLYNLQDIESAMKLWRGVPYKKSFTVGDINVTFYNAGHILGSTMVEMVIEGKRLFFTGDLGNVPMPLLSPPEAVSGMNIIVIESAYGNRTHEDAEEKKLKLERTVEDVVKREGVLMIPSFALERTQELLFEFNNLVEAGRIPRVPIYIDSPLAIRATEIYKKYEGYLSKETQNIIKEGDDIFKFPGLHLTLTTDESKTINEVRPPKIIIAGAGMMTGGRILHHARQYLPGKNNILLFIGYQAAGSLGRRIIDGEKMVRIFDTEVPIRAEVRSIRGYSAHADTNALFNFVKNNTDSLKRVFVVQGEPAASLFLAQRIRDYLGIDAGAPLFGEQAAF